MMPRTKGVAAYVAARNHGTQTVDFHLLRKDQEIASAHLEQAAIAEGVRQTPVHDDGLRGVLFTPPGAGRHPAVLVVGGSNGGVPLRPAAWLASHGYVAFALAYFRFEDLPPQLEGIPLEYFQKALQWMARRPEIGDTRVAVLGTSRGGELALQLGSMYPRIGAVVAYVPANVRIASCCRQNGTAAWTWQGRALPYIIPAGTSSVVSGPAVIEVENTKGPILMISGEADHLWNSWAMADDVVSRLASHHFAYSYREPEISPCRPPRRATGDHSRLARRAAQSHFRPRERPRRLARRRCPVVHRFHAEGAGVPRQEFRGAAVKRSLALLGSSPP